MKKTTLVILSTVLIITFFNTPSSGGTLIVGGKFWFAWWDSGGIRKLFNDANNTIDADIKTGLLGTFASAGSTTEGTLEVGRGFMTGPIISYLTDDRLWTFSAAFMQFSIFNQKASATNSWWFEPGSGSGKFDITYEFEMSRREIDLAVIRRLFSNFTVFAGVKYAVIDMTMDIEGIDPSSTLPDFKSTTKFYMQVIAPSLGFSFAYPFTDWFAAGLQAGILFSTPLVEVIENNGTETHYIYETTIGYNGECSLTFLINEKFVVQTGYRFQLIKEESDLTDADEWAFFHGVTFTAVYLIDI